MNLHQKEGKNKENKDLFVINVFQEKISSGNLQVGWTLNSSEGFVENI